MTIKKCTSCKIEKSLEQFSKKYKDRFQSKCKECTKIYLKNHYLKNKEYYIDKAQQHNKRYRKNGRQFVWDYLKEHPCVDCGEKDPIVLEFDHFRDKEYDISSMVHKSISIKKIKSEIDKCEIRCANCHRRKTAKQLNWHNQINK
jgi:hypothetical protein